MGSPAHTQRADTADVYTALSTYDKPAIRRYQKRTRMADLSHLPGTWGVPFLGHLYWMLKDVHAWLDTQYQQYGPVFRARTPRLDSVFLLGPEANQLVFQNEQGIFSNFLAWDQVFATLFDNNLLERDFADHKANRRILQSAFKRPAIEGHMELMNPMLRDGIFSWQTGRTIKAMDHVKTLLLNTGARVFLGTEAAHESDKLNKAFTAVVAATADPFKRKEIWFAPYAKGLKGRQVLNDYMTDNIPRRRNQPGHDLLSQFCQLRDDDGELFSDEAIRDHIIFVLFAAHDTTTSALSAILYTLATNQAWQDELRAEMHDLNKDELEFDDVPRLKKTGLTLKEALRMYPALPVMPRYTLEEFEFKGHRIPANAIVTVSSLFTHYMPEYWHDPRTFDPYRFSPERAEEKQDFFQYIPFGGGAHKCLGMHFSEVQSKMFLFHLLKNFRVSKDPRMTSYRYNNVPLTFPTDGLPLRFDRL
jgi:cytochrome P450